MADYKPLMAEQMLPNNPKQDRIAVAMSGGVDSSVTAAILAEQGYDVVGLTMQLYDHGAATAKSKTCCAGQDIYDARRVADKLDIPHYVLDFESRFKKDVITPFAQSYLRGETPVPCILCNQTVKFRDLIEAARGIGATALATGHYIKRLEGPDGPQLARAVDHERDQSYFLFATTTEQLDFLRFPLGELPKSKTRLLAEKFGLAVANKTDSQDICFVPTGSYTDVVKRMNNGVQTSGRIVHVDGRDMGAHDGIEKYTVGQRRGLGLGGEVAPLYVVGVNSSDNTVVVGPQFALAKSQIDVRDVNWLGADKRIPIDGVRIQARIRNTAEPVSAFVRPSDKDAGATVEFSDAQFGVSPGQACVFYDDDIVLGGGWISSNRSHNVVPHNKRQEAIPGMA